MRHRVCPEKVHCSVRRDGLRTIEETYNAMEESGDSTGLPRGVRK